MKKKIICSLMALLLALSFVACKKDGEKKADASQKVEKSKKSSDSLKENPSSDFRYTMTDDGAGVKITAYIGKSPKIIIPAEIEGLPVLEVEALAKCDHEEDEYWNDIFDKWVQVKNNIMLMRLLLTERRFIK